MSKHSCGRKAWNLARLSRFALFWRTARSRGLAERPVCVPPRFQLHSLVRVCKGDIDRFVSVVRRIASVYSFRMLERIFIVRGRFVSLKSGF